MTRPGHLNAIKSVARRISARFDTPFHRHFAYWKVQMDPLYQGVGDLLAGSRLPVLDVGCGSGLLCFYLLERGMKGPLHGLDFDRGKIEAARSAARRLPEGPVFHLGDARSPWPRVKGHVCLLDVLHYLPPEDQGKLLASAASQVEEGGLLVVRSGLRENNWRYRFTLFTDRLMNRLRLMKSPPVSYPDRQTLEATLRRAGLPLKEMRPLHKGTPFNNYLLVFERCAAAAFNAAVAGFFHLPG